MRFVRLLVHVLGVLLCAGPMFTAGMFIGLPWKPGTSFESGWYYVWDADIVFGIAVCGPALFAALALWITLVAIFRTQEAPVPGAIAAPNVRLRRAFGFTAITASVIELGAIVARTLQSSYGSGVHSDLDAAHFARFALLRSSSA
jgi:hypothetical protein